MKLTAPIKQLESCKRIARRKLDKKGISEIEKNTILTELAQFITAIEILKDNEF